MDRPGATSAPPDPLHRVPAAVLEIAKVSNVLELLPLAGNGD